jgi:hypothetical protein
MLNQSKVLQQTKIHNDIQIIDDLDKSLVDRNGWCLVSLLLTIIA